MAEADLTLRGRIVANKERQTRRSSLPFREGKQKDISAKPLFSHLSTVPDLVILSTREPLIRTNTNPLKVQNVELPALDYSRFFADSE
jgi:hypothetical protein